MEDKERQRLELLIELFNQRELLYSRITEKIAQHIGGTTLAALYEFFGVSYEAINWIEFQLIDTVVLITGIVTYKAGDEVPDLVEHIAPIQRPDDRKIAEIQRMMRIGVPVDRVFDTKEQILAFLKEKIAQQEPTPQPPTVIVEQKKMSEDNSVPINVSDFDSQDLTKEQKQQLLYFQHHTTGTTSKH